MALLGYLGREIKNEGNLKEYLEVDSKLGGYPVSYFFGINQTI